MNKVKNYVIMFIVFICGLIVGGNIQLAYANESGVTNTQNIMNTNATINTQTIYVDGQRYIVFTSGSSSIAVIKK
jgi:hypothetical protein